MGPGFKKYVLLVFDPHSGYLRFGFGKTIMQQLCAIHAHFEFTDRVGIVFMASCSNHHIIGGTNFMRHGS